MTLIAGATAPVFTLDHATFTGLASPSRGAKENCTWRLTLVPGATPMEHSLDREEIFVALNGIAEAVVGGVAQQVNPGDALVVPANTPFSIANPHDVPFEAVVVLPVGAQARIATGESFVPQWAQ